MVNCWKIYILEKMSQYCRFMLNNIGKFFKLLIVRIKPMRIRGECMEKRPVKKNGIGN